MTLIHNDVLVVAGVSVCNVSWFIVEAHSLLLASATADAARISQQEQRRQQQQQSHGDGMWTEDEGVQLDFVFYDAKVSAMNDKSEVIDYTFLTAQPRPSQVPGEALAAYQARLKRWMEACYASYYAAHFIAHLRSASPALFLEYDSVSKLIGTADGQRPVHGLVAPTVDVSGDHLISFTIPLLLTKHSLKVFQSLSNLAVLYCKVSHAKWRPSYQLTGVEVDVHACFSTAQRTGRITLIAESVVLRLRDAAVAGEADAKTEGNATDSLIPLLHSCVNLQGLPRLTMAHQRAGFLDYIPRLEQALYRRIREPLHFMKLVLGLMADFGSPIDVSVSCRELTVPGDGTTLPPPPSPPMPRTATFCVVDRTTKLSFTIGLHYQSAYDLPSVETTCNQYLDARHGAAVSRRVRFLKSPSSMRTDDDGFLDIEDLRVTVVHATLECMSASVALA
ncbi:hypothetical protein Q4I32_001089 [Leishmania shawi]|uniref:Mediator complex subunit 14 n=1 Tax=Leishmania shawi TaxID=5680 RepID=A0AAW3C834_9TRYP